ncbi:hypothetical protein AB0I68_10215 [Streptomyces sp. NPDC050448]|uniref:hypothetical protein n=1 Tax=Streptomyces sp. NPDC050448 TaxID=3155404 RepID=UPI003421A56D
MVTAWSSSGISRARFSAGPLRVLWLAALLFGFLFTHDASAHSASAQPAASAVTTSAHTPGETAGEQHHDDSRESSHPAAECASGQPQQASGPVGPWLTPLDGQLPCYRVVAGKSGPPANASALPPLQSATGSVIQQV